MSDRLGSLRDRALYGLALLATGVVALIPAGLVDALAARLGRLVFGRAGSRADRLRANLRVVVGTEAPDSEIERLAEGVYAAYGQYLAEFFTMHWPDFWGRRHRLVVDETTLREAKRQGNGVVLFGIHAGNWDLAASECARRYGAFHSAGESVEPAWLGLLTNRVRRGAGTRLYDPMSAARPLLRALREGDIIGLVADRAVAGPGVDVELCGRSARLPVGPVWLALRNGAPMLPTAIERQPDGTVFVEFLEQVELTDLKPNAEGIAVGVQRMADALTVLIRRAYPSWFALQEVWKDEG
jgi:KDO2-lipid IV(A) lauroyltransferase